jgi:glycosyltransferase involved in cell wall biosynthesis
MYLISIITVNFNNAHGLEKTINSVINQTFKNIEYIIIDGCSTDGSVDVLKKYESKINYWESEKDNGVFYAQNKGLLKANGDYILVLNSGDELENSKALETIFLTEHKEDIIYGNMVIVDSKGDKNLGKMPAKITFNHMMNDTLWHPVSFVKKEFLKKVGNYDVSYKIVADYHWFLKAIYKCQAQLKYEDMPISLFYLDGMSSDPKNVQTIKEERIKAQLSVFNRSEVEAYYKNSNSFANKVIHFFRKGWSIIRNKI